MSDIVKIDNRALDAILETLATKAEVQALKEELLAKIGTTTPPVVIPPVVTSDLPTVKFQNTKATTLAVKYFSFGQMFKPGALKVGERPLGYQMDVKNKYADGSVKYAVLSKFLSLAGGTTFSDAIQKSTSPLLGVDITDFSNLVLSVKFSAGITKTIDLAPLIKASTDFWLKGPIASQKRCEVLVSSSMRIIADVTKYQDGTYQADLLFANDIAMGAVGGTLSYTVATTFMGKLVDTVVVPQHFQYAQFRKVYNSAGTPEINVQTDAKYLMDCGGVLPYRLDLAVSPSILTAYDTATKDVAWGKPFAINGLTTYMPTTGGRADIGPLTQAEVVWLMTGDERAKKYVLGQAEAAASIPWHYYDKANNQWLNLEKYPDMWLDGRNNRPPMLTQYMASPDTNPAQPWTPETSHHPSLNYLPYLMTGTRYHLDQLNSQAAFVLLAQWNDARMYGQGVIVKDNQVRGAAWGLRDLGHAAFINPDGSWAKQYFEKMTANNLNWILENVPKWKAEYGEIFGILPGAYGYQGVFAPWQQDYFHSVVALLALQGDVKAKSVITDFTSNFIVGRFTSPTFNIRNGVSYNLRFADTNGVTYTTWKQVQDNSNVNGDTWSQSDGNYGQLGDLSLALSYRVTKDPKALDAFNKLNLLSPPYTSEADYQLDPINAVDPVK